MAQDFHSLRAALERAGQAHLLQGFENLRAEDQRAYLAELATLDLARVAQLQAVLRGAGSAKLGQFQPADVLSPWRDPQAQALAHSARASGSEWLQQGKVAALTVAGGQASRLGYEAPKGVYPIGPLSGYSLFEIFARKLRAAGARYGFRPLWYVMTSPANDAATQAFFAENRHFGLEASQVFFFPQDMLPALAADGRVIRASALRLFRAPTGHGGVLEALQRSGALAHAREHGVEQFAYFQVDNPLAPPFDDVFLGLHRQQAARMSSKVVQKRDAGEKVGVLAYADSKLSCIEYSDLPSDLREARDEKGQLLYSAGNIAIHLIERSFVEELTQGALELPWHLARKLMPVYDPHLGMVEREGIKFETFVFDALAFTPSSVVLEVEREREFSPVKNASGPDSVHTSRADLCRLHARLAHSVGWPVPAVGSDGFPWIEIDPLLGEDPEHLRLHGPRQARREAQGWFYT